MVFSSATEQDFSAMAVEIHPAKTYIIVGDELFLIMWY